MPKNLRIVTPNLIVSDSIGRRSKHHPNGQYRNNKIHTSKYTWLTFLPKNLFEQFYRFANLYFLLIQILNWLPEMEVFVREVQSMPLIFVLSVTAIKDLFEDRRRHSSDKRVNNATCRRYDKKSKCFIRTKWSKLEVGDLIHLNCNEIVPADILLLRAQSAESDDYGTCYVETSNLDGENNLKPRFVPNEKIEDIDFNFVVECEKPNMKLHKFQGSIIYSNDNRKRVPINKDNLLLRDCRLKNTTCVEGLVIYAGHETKAMLNNKGPRHKRSRLERMMNRDIIMCVVILIIMCIICFVGKYLWLEQFTVSNRLVPYTNDENPVDALDFLWPLRSFSTFLILYQMIIPISLYVCIEMIKLGQVYIINRDVDLIDPNSLKRCECRAWNITEDLGQIEYMFCDKTGTLTENVMEFRCCSIKGINYEHETTSVDSMRRNSEIKVNPKLKEKIDRIANKYQKWSIEKKLILNEEEQAIHDFFMVLTFCNTASCSSFDLNNDDEEDEDGRNSITPFNLEKSLVPSERRTHSFDLFQMFHSLSRKSIEKSSKKAKNFGPNIESESSDMTILERLSSDYETDSRKKEELTMIKHHLHQYSTKGLRGLCVAKRILTKREFDKYITELERSDYPEKREKFLNRLYNSIESNLELLGATAIEDRLQERVPDVILSLRKAGITIWVLTGDNMETAISIAKSCSLFNSEMNLLRINYANVKSRKTARMELLNKLETIRNYSREQMSISIEQSTSNDSTRRFSRLSRVLKKIYDFLNKEPQHQQHHQLESNLGEQSVNRKHFGLVIDGPSLNFVLQKENLANFILLTKHCGSVLCCRTTPSQKSFVVKCVKNRMNMMTVAVGDGANDVSMIQTAHVGIGIHGLEGSQAAMASDFAIPKFHFLERLILVHGNLCYNRLASTILYFFYKNTMVVFVLFFYQFLCGFSGSSLLDDVYLMAVNIFYTTLPAIVRGILEKDNYETTFIEYPELYERGRKSLVYTDRSFWVNLLDSIYQSFIIFFLCFYFYTDSSIGLHEFGLIIIVVIIITNLLQISIETKYWNDFFVLSIFISLGFFITSAMFLDFNYSNSMLSILGGRNYKILMQNVIFQPKFFPVMILLPVICLIPRFTLRALQQMLKPQFKLRMS
ncbi:phospholipid-transporting ATPase VB-like protein [Sarcoptes scabiei]|uniref:Phospholipid-transporting ATPase n=1 Tax=Sarcoptes scabiei TaxID=52283 RepID=A0A132A032_SARSC|nr:phospholipid-transporting ATPase VB-like protein [Sarcoptes scabiei]